MRKKPKLDFATVLHLAENYQDQYREMNLCLSPEQNEASFRDFVWQYTSAVFWGKEPNPILNPHARLY